MSEIEIHRNAARDLHEQLNRAARGDAAAEDAITEAHIRWSESLERARVPVTDSAIGVKLAEIQTRYVTLADSPTEPTDSWSHRRDSFFHDWLLADELLRCSEFLKDEIKAEIRLFDGDESHVAVSGVSRRLTRWRMAELSELCPDALREMLESDPTAPQPLNSGEEGETLYYDRAEVRPWLAAKTGIDIDKAERLIES